MSDHVHGAAVGFVAGLIVGFALGLLIRWWLL